LVIADVDESCPSNEGNDEYNDCQNVALDPLLQSFELELKCLLTPMLFDGYVLSLDFFDRAEHRANGEKENNSE
jgi:hypothetical protein